MIRVVCGSSLVLQSSADTSRMLVITLPMASGSRVALVIGCGGDRDKGKRPEMGAVWSEQRKLDAGQSTVFLVLERQTQLATARGNELRAQTELNKAIAELQRATGNSLEQNQVEVHVR